MFPTGAPGIGLLVLRISLAAAVLDSGSDGIASSFPLPITLALGALSLLLFLGLLTPVVSLAGCAFELARLFIADHTDGRFMVLSSMNAAAIGLLGPGAYSLDARLFGRREILLRPGGKTSRR